jgi:MazG family protein
MADSPLPNTRRLLDIMARLRDPATGCPWDVEQNFATIAPYTIEEAYEVAEAIAQGDMDGLKGELGDLLLQVVFHTRMAEEEGRFDFEQVAGAIADKMVERHPHVFGEAQFASEQEQKKSWEDIKAEKRQGGALADIPQALPALMRAQKIGKRVARLGFDWDDMAGARAKLKEELAEFDAATTEAERQEELGDVLFTLAMVARHAGVDAEEALRQANRKFERRWARMEALAKAEGVSVEGQPLEVLEGWWGQAKREEKTPSPVGGGSGPVSAKLSEDGWGHKGTSDDSSAPLTASPLLGEE